MRNSHNGMICIFTNQNQEIKSYSTTVASTKYYLLFLDTIYVNTLCLNATSWLPLPECQYTHPCIFPKSPFTLLLPPNPHWQPQFCWKFRGCSNWPVYILLCCLFLYSINNSDTVCYLALHIFFNSVNKFILCRLL